MGGGEVGGIGEFVSVGEIDYAFDFAGKLMRVGDRQATVVLENGATVGDGTLSALATIDGVVDGRILVTANYTDAAGTRRGVFEWDRPRESLVGDRAASFRTGSRRERSQAHRP